MFRADWPLVEATTVIAKASQYTRIRMFSSLAFRRTIFAFLMVAVSGISLAVEHRSLVRATGRQGVALAGPFAAFVVRLDSFERC